VTEQKSDRCIFTREEPSAQRHYCIFSGKFPILCAVLSHVNSLERCPERLKFRHSRCPQLGWTSCFYRLSL